MRATSATQGLPWEKVIIRGIDAGAEVVEVENHIGKTRRVPLTLHRAKGALPVVGETWVIDRSLGYWTLAAVIQPTPPTITGARDGGVAETNLLATLAQMGLLVDNTTAGAPGGGAGMVSYVHIQETPSAIWTIPHGLSFKPGGVYVEDTGGTNVEGDQAYPSTGVLVITFSASFGGKAYLS